MTESLIHHLLAEAARLREEAERDRIFGEDLVRPKMAAATIIEQAIEVWLDTELNVQEAMEERNCTDRTLRDKYPSTGSGHERRWKRRELLYGRSLPTVGREKPIELSTLAPSGGPPAGDNQIDTAVQEGVAEALRRIA